MSLFGNSGGALSGIPTPGQPAGVGALYPPIWCKVTSGPLTTTATRLYYIPYYFENVVSFTGLKTRNTTTTDSGDTFRMGVYQRDPTTFLPSTLVADCGQATVSGSAADITLASSFTPAYVGWHFLAFHSNQAVQVTGLERSAFDSAAGYAFPNGVYGFGVLANVMDPYVSGISVGSSYCAYSVDTAYGALASTAVAPTTMQRNAPFVAPYRT